MRLKTGLKKYFKQQATNCLKHVSMLYGTGRFHWFQNISIYHLWFFGLFLFNLQRNLIITQFEASKTTINSNS